MYCMILKLIVTIKKKFCNRNYWWLNYSYICWISTIFNSLRGEVLRPWRIHKIKLRFIFLINSFLKRKRRICKFWYRCIFKYEASWRSRSSNLRKTTYDVLFRISTYQCYCRILYDLRRLHYQIRWSRFTVHDYL